MERIKTRIIIEVTERLRGAKDTNAKTELIEELSENLYQRYLEFTASGVDEDEAYRCAMEDLGDVDELLDYLEDMNEDSEPRSEERHGKEHFNNFLRVMEDVIRETVSQTKDAVDQAKVIARDLSKKFHEKYPDGVQLHCGYDKEKGGFYWESNGKGRPVEVTTLPAENVKALDIQLHNGDVDVNVLEQDVVEVSGDAEDLEIRLDDDGVLYIRQGKTASSSVVFGRGLARTDVELTLPARLWEFVKINTVNGDVQLADALEANELSIQTVSGDITAQRAHSPHMTMQSVSGDIECTDVTGSIAAESKSGDITIRGSFAEVGASSMSGDVELTGMAVVASGVSMSGDVAIEMDALPRELRADSKSGDCDVRVPAGKGFTVNLHTISGDFDTDFELVGTIGRKSGSAVYLDGGDSVLTISSISGDITLEKQ